MAKDSKSKIESATPEQWQQIDELREEIIASQTDRIKIDDARAAVDMVWQRLGWKPPIVLQASSPIQACAIYARFVYLMSSEMKHPVTELLEHRFGSMMDLLVAQLNRHASKADDKPVNVRAPGGRLTSKDIAKITTDMMHSLTGQMYGELCTELAIDLQTEVLERLRAKITPLGKSMKDEKKKTENELDAEICEIEGSLHDACKAVIESMRIDGGGSFSEVSLIASLAVGDPVENRVEPLQAAISDEIRNG